MADDSQLDRKYFINQNTYNCPYCNRRHVAFEVCDLSNFDWSDTKPCAAWFVRCKSCHNVSMHLTFEDLERVGYPPGIAVVCMAERYWQPVLDELRKATDLPLHTLEQRGERLPVAEPVVVLSRPAHIGGQEFDGVLLIGAEEGAAPPAIVNNEPLAMAVEEQSLREYYIAISRARSTVIALLDKDALLSPILVEAERAGLLRIEAQV